MRRTRSVKRLLLQGMLVLIIASSTQLSSPSVALAAPTHVQSATAADLAAATTIGRAFTTANVAGNAIVAAVSWDGTAPLSCSDSRGNTYAVAVTAYEPISNQSLGICVATNITAGANTVTASWGGASIGYRRLLIGEYSGVATSNAIDVVKANQGTATTAANNATTGSATTTVPNALIVGAVEATQGPIAISAGTGFTQRASVNNKTTAIQDRVLASPGPVASTQTFGTSARYAAVMVALKPGTPPPTPSYVQSAATGNLAAAPTITQAFSSANAAGNAIVAVVSWDGTATMSCSDTRGNTYVTAVTAYISQDNQSTGICVATNVAAGTNTVTASWGGASIGFRRLIVAEYRNVATANAIDVVKSNSALATTAANNVTTGSATTTTANDLIVGAVEAGNGPTSITAGTGFTQRASVNNKTTALQDRVLSSPGPVASTQTFGNAYRYAAVMVALKPAVVTASFTATTVNGSTPLTVNVDAAASTSPFGSITNYAWNFGDSTTATGQTASHTYAAPGSYTISLTVTDSTGQTATTTRPVTVYAAPTASFTTTPTSGNVPLTVNVDGTASASPAGGTITTYAWNFGDGGTATGQTASHTYTTPGTFSITLTVTDNRNNTATTTSAVTATAVPASGLVFELTWSGNADVDLAVSEPNGTLNYYGNPGPSSTGAVFTGDNACAGAGSHTETVTWNAPAPTGTYSTHVEQYDTCGAPAPTWTLRIIHNGTVVSTQTGTGTTTTDITYNNTGA